jgi:hypothetical protein
MNDPFTIEHQKDWFIDNQSRVNRILFGCCVFIGLCWIVILFA